MNARQRCKASRADHRAIAKLGRIARRVAELWQEKNEHEERIEEIVFLVRK